jgi:hypothetical protein
METVDAVSSAEALRERDAAMGECYADTLLP